MYLIITFTYVNSEPNYYMFNAAIVVVKSQRVVPLRKKTKTIDNDYDKFLLCGPSSIVGKNFWILSLTSGFHFTSIFTQFA